MIRFLHNECHIYNPFFHPQQKSEQESLALYGFELWSSKSEQFFAKFDGSKYIYILSRCGNTLPRDWSSSDIAIALVNGVVVCRHPVPSIEQVAKTLNKKYRIQWGLSHGRRIPDEVTGARLYEGFGLTDSDLLAVESMSSAGQEFTGNFERDFSIFVA